MAQIQCKTSPIRIPLSHATAEQFYSVFNPPYLIRDICSQIGIDIQIAADQYHATIQVPCRDGKITITIEVEVIRIEPPKKTTTWIANDLSCERELKLEVTDGRIVKWTVSSPPPANDYVQRLESVSQAVDNHFRQN